MIDSFFSLLKFLIACMTLIPIAFLVAFSLPHNSEMRQMAMRICYWGLALFSIVYLALPIDIIPDVFFPIGYAEDAALVWGAFQGVKKSMRPISAEVSRN